MRISACTQWLMLVVFLSSTCPLLTNARRGGGGGGGGSRGGSSGSYSIPSYSRPAPAPSYRPAPAPSYKPAPAPAYKPKPASSYRPRYVYRPSARPRYAYRPSARPTLRFDSRLQPPVTPKSSLEKFARQPAYNPSFKEPGYRQSSAGRQPAYNPNYKPDSSGPAGPPPLYSPAGHPAPIAPAGPPPSYHSSQPGVQPPPYPGLPGARPPAYPGISAPYPVQPGSQFRSNQPGVNRPYPVQPGYPGSYQSQPGVNRPYPVQPSYPGSFHQQPGINRPYPVQPGVSYPGGSRPYPQQPLGGNVWQPHYGMPSPAYMNYGGIPTGTNIYTKPHKKKGFIGSLLSVGKPKPMKQHKYYGSYPSPYGGVGHMEGNFLGKHGGSASMNTIFPYMVAKKAPKIMKPRFGFMPMYMPRPHYHGYHHYHYHGHGGFDDDDKISQEYAQHFDVYGDDYVGKCQQPIKKEHSEVKCKATYNDIHCDARCEEGYRFPRKIELVSNKCWHATGVWRPRKNFPDCEPVCQNACLNGGQCIRPGVCKCTPEFRGSRCQFSKSSILNCDIQVLVKGEKVGWVCNHFKNESVCKIRCTEPAQFETPAADEYRCSPDGVWKPNTLPHCVTKEKINLESVFLEK